MGFWGSIGGGFKKAGRWVGGEVGRIGAPIVSAIEGDYRGALSGIGRNITRAGQLGAVFGKDKLAGVDVDLLGAAGGAVEGALGPSDIGREYLGDTGSGGFASALSRAATGYGGVQAGKGLHNIGERLGINKRLGALTNKVGITSPDPFMRLEGETDDAFVDRVQRRKYDEQLMNSSGYGEVPEWDPSLSAEQNHDNRNFARRMGRAQAARRIRIEDPRSLKIGGQYFGGPEGPGDLSPGSAGSNFIDRAIGEETAQLDKWNRENVPNIDPQTGLSLGARLPQASPGASAGNMPSQIAMAEAERNRARQSQGGRTAQNTGNQFATTPSAPYIPGRSGSLAQASRLPQEAPQDIPALNLGTGYATDGYMTPPPGYSNIRGPVAPHIAQRFRETGFTGPRNAGDGDPNKKWWQRGLDYVGENIDADTLVNAAGQLMGGRGEDEYYRGMLALREQQAAYDQDRQRLIEALQLRGSTSKWA